MIEDNSAFLAKVKKTRKRFIFNRQRTYMRFLVGPVFLAFSFVDYIYQSKYFYSWTACRLIFFLYVWGSFYYLSKKSLLRKYIEWNAVFLVVLASSIVNLMIYQSGGYESRYTMGTILCVITGINIFKLNKFYGGIAQSLSYIPAIIIVLLSASSNNFKDASIVAVFYVGMFLLSFILGQSDEAYVNEQLIVKSKMKKEIDKLNKSEMLKKHFPAIVRLEIEKNPESVAKKREVENLIIGFADISNSTAIANRISLDVDWALKEKFLDSATKNALANQMVVLTHMGDGFLFLVNYVTSENWQENLIAFFKTLTEDYEKLYANIIGISGQIESGIKFGVSKGSAIVGFLGEDQSYFTAIGASVNLASRLCSKAGLNQVVITAELYEELSAFLNDFSCSRSAESLKGFSGIREVITFFRTKKMQNNNDVICPLCKKSMSIGKNTEGYLDYICLNCSSKAEHGLN